MTELSFMISQNWIAITVYAVAMWIALFLYRKNYKIKIELKRQVISGLVTSVIASLGDVIGTSLNLWHFPDGDVPVIIILVYFFVGMFGYNVVKIIDEKVT